MNTLSQTESAIFFLFVLHIQGISTSEVISFLESIQLFLSGYLKVPGKSHNHTAQAIRGTETRREKEQTIAKHNGTVAITDIQKQTNKQIKKERKDKTQN